MTPDDGRLRVLTITQPHASLVAVGAKRIETRGWSTRWRGQLAIAAGASLPPFVQRLGGADPISMALARGGIHAVHDLPLGRVLAVVDVLDVISTTDVRMDRLLLANEFEARFGDYSSGRFGWHLGGLLPLAEPVPVRGRQRIWFAPDDVAAAVRAQIGEAS
jgi:hypothetical protein